MTSKLLSLVLTAVVVSLVLLLVSPSRSTAHSGRTDSSGGHNCYVDPCAGTYHYHNGGGYTAPPTPNYYQQGMTNGKAHAERDSENIRVRTRSTGYQTGYSAGASGATRSYYAVHPDSICDINFTFDPGTSEIYKSAYKTGWLNGCNMIARAVYQASYDEGYVAGAMTKPATTSTNNTAANSSEKSSDEWIVWAILGGIIGLPLLGGIIGGIKDWWNKPTVNQ